MQETNQRPDLQVAIVLVAFPGRVEGGRSRFLEPSIVDTHVFSTVHTDVRLAREGVSLAAAGTSRPRTPIRPLEAWLASERGTVLKSHLRPVKTAPRVTFARRFEKTTVPL